MEAEIVCQTGKLIFSLKQFRFLVGVPGIAYQIGKLIVSYSKTV